MSLTETHRLWQVISSWCVCVPVFNIINNTTDLPPMESERLNSVSCKSAGLPVLKAVEKRSAQEDSIQNTDIFRSKQAFSVTASII